MKKVPVSTYFPEYGIDTPQATGFVLAYGLLLAFLAWFIKDHPLQLTAESILCALFLVSGLLLMTVGLWIVWTSWKGKRKSCGRFLDSLKLKGGEKLLDLGCGRGLVMTEAAKRLRKGKASGIDDWSQSYLFGNNREKTLENAKTVGVETRVEVVTGDMRRLPFSKGQFEVVAAYLALHRIKDREERLKVLREAARVLKRGGRIAIQDFLYNGQTVEDLKKVGFQKIQISTLLIQAFPPLRRILAVKK